jgi:hypothetical protein
MEMTFPFSLHGRKGTVTVVYRANDDPERWGYSVLGLSWPPSLAEGLPVLEARVSSPLEGYAAVMGWIGGEKAPPGDHAWVDGPPQLRGLGVPFVSFGQSPSLFDAPASTESDIRFVADSFLTASPDALISRRSQACLGLRWGYSTKTDRKPELLSPSPLAVTDWQQALPLLEENFPDWTFELEWGR